MSRRTKTTIRGVGGGEGDHVLAALSHELRTPLNGVLGMADLLSRTRLDPAQRAYLTALRESGEHLLGLVNDVLGLAKIEQVGFELVRAPVDVERLLQTTAELLSPRAHAKGLEIVWCADAGLSHVMADEGRLRQILLNLAGNAVKFTSEGAVLISAERAQGDRLRFQVRDTGPGVAETDQGRIFEPFAQGPSSQAGQIESTGLGLAIVRKLAAAFEGEIGLQSAPGQGASFWFEADFPPAGPATADVSLADVCVAIVSGNALMAEAAARQVEACGGRALKYTSIAAAKSAPPGCPMLVDYGMRPRHRSRPPAERPSIVLLTPEQRERIPALRKAGFDGYLIKPLRRQSLATRVLAVCQLANPPASQPMTAEDERAQSAAASGARVLLAEDNPINAILGRALLEREGCTVDRVKTGPSAVAAAASNAYDLILLDLRMPGLSGVEAAREMRRQGIATPIAALTADAFDDTRRECLEAGMDDFLTKPLSPSALRALLGRLIRPGFTESRAAAKLAV
jgi:CheY-like chemotaxis protein/anti-sigma regulatory factor (Ser/Thr protein kinase)